MASFNRRQFLAAGAGLAAASMLPGCTAELEELPPMGTFGVNDFASDLYAKLRSESGNVFLSPYSISTALAMTAAGAKGNTLAQMQQVLHLPANAAEADAAYQHVAGSLARADKSIQLAVANALWAQKGYPWSPDYTARVKKTFKAEIRDVDYTADPEACRKTINTWVEKQTKDKIKDLMPDGSIDRLTRLVLTNAIYFKGDWLTAFEKKFTKDQPFTMTDGSKKDVPLMYRSGRIDYFANDDVTVIRLPYKGSEVSFIGVLPEKPDAFARMDEGYTAKQFDGWVAGLRPQSDVKVWLPRFKIETRYILNDTLSAMGMPDAFSPKADFGGMVTTASELVISIVVHKAFVDVNEEGTEAAAATGVAVALAAAPVQVKPKVFRADRPFLFALRHEPTKTILFMGRYSKVG